MREKDSEVVLETRGLEVAIPAGAGGFRLGPIDWRVCPGELWVVAGPHGAGKTALLETLAGLIPAASGAVRKPSTNWRAAPVRV